MFACETAVQSFKSILDTLGGDAEVIRAEHLLELVTVVPDSPSFRTQCLPNTGKIKERSKVKNVVFVDQSKFYHGLFSPVTHRWVSATLS